MKKPRILGADGRPFPKSKRLKATYDAASTTDLNKRHWAPADNLSARSANSLDVRMKLRNRARYEDDNNGYCNGLINTLANDLIGTGPTLQIQTESDEDNERIEAAFAEWAEAIGFADKLRTMKCAKTRDGEAFALLTTNPLIDNPVQLDLRLVECDQVSTPAGAIGTIDFGSGSWVDGIEFDAYGNPVVYHILATHPGDDWWIGTFGEYRREPARNVIHWFTIRRPGQARGVPEITSSLPLFAQLRRYTLATVTAAETAANVAGMLETLLPPNTDEDAEEGAAFEALEIIRGMLMTLPSGYKLSQLKAEHPTTEYQEFKRELLKEIARPVSAPFNVVSGDSSPYNYSSARLDHILYRIAMRVERVGCRRSVLSRVKNAWLDEAVMVPGLLPPVNITALKHDWNWPGQPTIDPLKESQADTEALANNTTTLAELIAEEGKDWKDVLRQRAREKEMLNELGLTEATPQTALAL